VNQNQLIFDNMKSLLFAAGNDHEGDLIDCCRILMIISGADGEVSETEWQIIFEFIDSVGGSFKIIDELKDFDYANSSLDQFINRIDPDFHKLLLYSAIKAARIDGLSDEERAQSVELARLAGIDTGVCAAMEHMLNMEDELRDMKRNILINS
jgi:tellurite resistance protein